MNITGYKQQESNNTSNLLNKENPNNLLITEIIKEKSADNYIVKKDYSNGDVYTCNGYEIIRKHNGKEITFKAKPVGDKLVKEDYIKNIEKLIGKMATVKYFAYSTDGVPTQPVFKSFREEGE